MKQFFIILLLLSTIHGVTSTQTPFEKNKLVSTTYDECIDYYKMLDGKFDILKMTKRVKPIADGHCIL
jgi:hypothetical protein